MMTVQPNKLKEASCGRNFGVHWCV